MDRKQRVALEKQRLVEIYRSCRLCGAGGGYKMPIIQQILPSDVDVETELKEKIRECVSIAVSKDDKMPPLICELCVDKVNDFYEFREMCLQINMQTRTKLGLPPQAMPSGSGDASDCILGITSQVYINPKEDDERVTVKSKAKSIPRITIKKEEKGWNKSVEGESPSTRSSRHSKTEIVQKPGPMSSKKNTRNKREPTPHRPQEKNIPLVRSSRSKICTQSPPSNREKSSKRSLDKSIELEPRSVKKVRIKVPSPSPPPPTRAEKRRSVTFSPVVSPAATKKSKQAAPDKRNEKKQGKGPERRFEKADERRHQRRTGKVAEKGPVLPTCNLCGETYSSKKGDLTSHLISHHSPTPTSERLSCASCRIWFTTLEDTLAHHRWHRSATVPYKCAKCQVDYKTQAAFNRHIAVGECIEDTVVPDVRCDQCWNNFATQNWMALHKCGGVDARPGGNCCKCDKKFVRYKQQLRHEETCAGKMKKRVSGVNPDNPHLGAIQPLQVRMQRCDGLLETIKMKPEPEDGAGVVKYNVSQVNPEFGYDKNCVYPYISSVGTLRIKTEDGFIMDSMKQEIMDEMYDTYEDDYIDGYSSSDEVLTSNMIINPFAVRDTKGVEKLSSISLRAVFSEKFLAYGNPPRRKRKKILKSLKAAEKEGDKKTPFDSLFEESGKRNSKSAVDDLEVLKNCTDEKESQLNVLDERMVSECVTNETENAEGYLDKTDTAESSVDETDTTENNVAEADTAESSVDETETTENNVAEADTAESNVDNTDTAKSKVDKTGTAESNVDNTDTAKSDFDNTDTAESNVDNTDTAKSDFDKTGTAESNVDNTDTAKSRVDKTDTAESNVDNTDTAKSDFDKTDTAESNVDNTDTAKSDFDKTDTTESKVDKTEAAKSDVDKTEAAVSGVEEINTTESHVDKTDAAESDVDKIVVLETDIDQQDAPESYMDKMVPKKDAMRETVAPERVISKKAFDADAVRENKVTENSVNEEVSASLPAETENDRLKPDVNKTVADTNEATNVHSNIGKNIDDIAIEGKSNKLIDKGEKNTDIDDTATGDVTDEHVDSVGEKIDRFLQDHDTESKKDDIDSLGGETKDTLLFTDVKINENIWEDKNLIVRENCEDLMENESLARNNDIGDLEATVSKSDKITTRKDSKVVVINISTLHNDVNVIKIHNSLSRNELKDVVVETKNVISEMMDDRLLKTSDDPTNLINENSLEASEKSQSRNISEDSIESQLDDDDSSKFGNGTEIDHKAELEKQKVLDESDLFHTNNSISQDSSKTHSKGNLDDESSIREMLVSDKNEILDDLENDKTLRSIEEISDSNLDYGDEATLLKSPERIETSPKCMESVITESPDSAMDKQIDNLEDVLKLDNISDDDFDFD